MLCPAGFSMCRRWHNEISKMRMERMGVIFSEVEREWKLIGFLCGDDLVLCSELEKNPRLMKGRLFVICKRGGLRVNADKSKVMVLEWEAELVGQVTVDRKTLEHPLKFNFLGFM